MTAAGFALSNAHNLTDNVRFYSGSDSSRRTRVLMIGPASPALGGMVSAISQIMNGPLSGHYDFDCHAANASSSLSSGLLSSASRHLKRAWNLWQTVLTGDFQLAHIHTCSGFSFYRNLFDAMILRLGGLPFVWHVHGGRFDQFVKRAGFFGQHLIRWAFNHADGVIVLSEGWKQKLALFAPQATFFVVPNAIESPVAPGVPPPSDEASFYRFIYLGPMTRAKGIDVLLEAAVQLKRKNLSYRLTLAGPHDASRDSVDPNVEIKRLGLAPAVEYRGVVTGHEKESLLDRSDCLVLPSRAEGMPMSILEAGVLGKAVVASNVGAVAELVGMEGAGLLVPPGNANAVGQAMAALISNPLEGLEAGRALKKRITNCYSTSRQADLLKRIYERLLRQKTPQLLTAQSVIGGDVA